MPHRYLHAKRCERRFKQHYSYHPEPVEAKECHSATDCESGINYSLLMRRHFFVLLFLYLFRRGTRSNRVPRENTLPLRVLVPYTPDVGFNIGPVSEIGKSNTESKAGLAKCNYRFDFVCRVESDLNNTCLTMQDLR